MQSNKVFEKVSNIVPSRSMFDLSYSKLFNCDMGQLIPVMHDECVPGDVFKISNEMVVRMQPLVAPVLHEINAYVHYFFIPYRLLWSSWEDFITGGEDGSDSSTLPTWTPSAGTTALYDLWDYFGFPLTITPSSPDWEPLQFPLNAYNLVWNEWYRAESIQTAVALTATDVLYRNWEKDYFTSSLEWQQRGTAPALPLSGTTTAEWGAYSAANNEPLEYNNVANVPYGATDKAYMDANTVDFSDATTFDVADLRLAFQIQKWMERNARAGARYTEYLKAHFGVSPHDARLDRPEYIGGSKQSIIVSEVLQTSETNTSPQGTLAGHGLSAGYNHVCNYRVEEFGMILGLLSIMPRTAYSQGINRQWLKETRYDFYSPEFANLSEQAIQKAEIYYEGDSTDDTVFGYQGRWDEMRTKQDLYCGDMRSTFDYWHLGRVFDSAPTLNSAFLKCEPDTRIFASETEPGFIVHFQNKILAYRPLPVASNPGLIDHV